MTNRLLITGGTGFFGRALLRHLHTQASGSRHPRDFAQVIVVSRDPQAFARRYPELATAHWLHWERADVMDAGLLRVLDKHHGLNAVLHAATDSTGAAGLSPLQQLDQIVDGTRNLLELSVRLGARRFMLTSSGGAYGPQPADMDQIPESYGGLPDPLRLGGTYGLAKRMAEHQCALYSHQYGLDSVVARCFAFVGEDLPMNAHFAIGNFIRDALWADEITVNGDGTPLRSYLDQRDLANWLIKLLLNGKSGEAYNVGSDEVVSISELAYLVRDLVSPDKPVRILGASQTNKDRNRYVPDITKIHKHLNVSPTFSLVQSILETTKIARSKGKEACLAA